MPDAVSQYRQASNSPINKEASFFAERSERVFAERHYFNSSMIFIATFHIDGLEL